jgi:hypothetical protein
LVFFVHIVEEKFLVRAKALSYLFRWFCKSILQD